MGFGVIESRLIKWFFIKYLLPMGIANKSHSFGRLNVAVSTRVFDGMQRGRGLREGPFDQACEVIWIATVGRGSVGGLPV